ncbi:MAG: hypothetical protein ACM3O4_00750 [Ignavibacteriales bacterium]
MKQECVSIYDIQNKKGIVIKSQVVLEIEKLGFEIASDYAVNDKKSNFNENDKGMLYFENINDDSIYLSFYYEKCTKKKFNEELEKYINRYHYDKFDNYRGQEIHEFIDNFDMYVMMYYENYMFIFKKNGTKFTESYFELYFTAYSLYKINKNVLEYNNPELEAQSGCIKNNGENVYKHFNHLNIVKKDPIKTVMDLKNQQLKDLLDKGINPDVELLLPNKTYFGRNMPVEEEPEVKIPQEKIESSIDKKQILERIENISKELEELKKLIEEK